MEEVNIPNLIIDNYEPKEIVAHLAKVLHQTASHMERSIVEQNMHMLATEAPNVVLAAVVAQKLSEKMNNGRKGPTVVQ